MALSLNVPSTPHTTYDIFLDGKSYKITFRWSSRTFRWYLDLITSQGIPVTVGAALIVNVPLINKTNVFAPEGQLYLINNTTSGLPPTRTNIGVGRDFELIYFTRKELSE